METEKSVICERNTQIKSNERKKEINKDKKERGEKCKKIKGNVYLNRERDDIDVYKKENGRVRRKEKWKKEMEMVIKERNNN